MAPSRSPDRDPKELEERKTFPSAARSKHLPLSTMTIISHKSLLSSQNIQR